MKKWLISLLILIVAITLFAPLGIGVITQNKYTEMLAQFSRAGAVDFTIKSYERHWFSSDVVVDVTVVPQKLFKTPEINDAPITFKLTQHIKHGPFLSVTPQHEKVHEYIGLALFTSHIDPKMGEVDGMSIMGFNAALLSVVRIPDFHYHSESLNRTIKMQNALLVLDNTYDLKGLDGEMEIAQLSLETGDLIQTIDNLKTSFNLRKGEGDLFFGDRKGTIDKLTWQLKKGMANIELSGIAMDTANSLDQEKLNVETQLTIKKLQIDNVNYGPQEVDLVVEGVDLPAFLLLRKALSKLEKDQNVTDSEFNNYAHIASLLISKGINVNLKKLYISTPWGNPELRMKLDFAPQSIAENAPMVAFSALNAEAHVQLPSVFLVKMVELINKQLKKGVSASAVPSEGVQGQIKHWSDNKLLIPSGNGYMADMVYKDQQLYINGQLLESSKQMIPAKPGEYIEVPLPALPQAPKLIPQQEVP